MLPSKSGWVLLQRLLDRMTGSEGHMAQSIGELLSRPSTAFQQAIKFVLFVSEWNGLLLITDKLFAISNLSIDPDPYSSNFFIFHLNFSFLLKHKIRFCKRREFSLAMQWHYIPFLSIFFLCKKLSLREINYNFLSKWWEINCINVAKMDDFGKFKQTIIGY